jgi:hypothetical protein
MDRFVHREGLRLLRERLTHTSVEADCAQIVKLFEEEELKARGALDGRDHAY